MPQNQLTRGIVVVGTHSKTTVISSCLLRDSIDVCSLADLSNRCRQCHPPFIVLCSWPMVVSSTSVHSTPSKHPLFFYSVIMRYNILSVVLNPFVSRSGCSRLSFAFTASCVLCLRMLKQIPNTFQKADPVYISRHGIILSVVKRLNNYGD